MASQNSFNTRTSLTAGRPARPVFQPPRARKGRFSGPGAAAVFPEDPAGEPAPAGGRPVRRRRRHHRRWPAGTSRSKAAKEIAFMPARVLLQDFTGVPAVVDLAAMRDGVLRLGGDPAQGQSAAAGRAGHRPLGPGRSLPRAERRRAERRARVLAQQGALHVPALGPDRVRQLQGGAARHRHRAPGQPRVPRARRSSASRRAAKRSPIPTRSSAPIRTRRWSTGWAWSAGASAASKRRRRCSASRSRC